MSGRPPRDNPWLPYLIVGGCALLALTIAAVGTLTLVSLGRDTPPEPASRTLQQGALAGGPTPAPAPARTLVTIPLVGTTPTVVGSPLPGPRVAEATPRAQATTAPGSSSAGSAGRRTGVSTYTVAPGDTLGSIATRYGLSLQTLVLANSLGNSELLRVGQELQIPAVDGLVHEVQAGDTVARIANLYGVSAEEIGRQNGLDGSYTIRVGQSLVIPGATRPLATPTSPAPTSPPATRVPASPTHAPTAAATRTPAQPTAAPQGQPTAAPQPTAVPQATAAPQPTAPPQPTAAPQPSTTPAPARGSFEWPAMGNIIAPFSADHPSLDLSGNQGAPVLASAAGTVASVAQLDSGYGWQIVLDHGNGLSTMYGYLSAIQVRAGDRVGKLQVIGAIGQTGSAPRTQLHFELRLNGQPVDPRGYLP